MSTLLRRLLTGCVLLCVALAALGWQLACNPAHEERDVVQERLDQASAPLAPGHSLGQTFTARHAGLKRIELLLVVYDPARELPASGQLVLTLEQLGAPPAAPLRAVVSTAGLKHNQRVAFPFAPQESSQRIPYRFTLTADGDYGLGLWHTASDAYAEGEMWQDGVATAGDLYFTTAYDYHLTDALGDLGAMMRQYGGAGLALLLALGLPGLALALWLPTGRRHDLGTGLALVLALSIAFWPLLLLWSSVIGVSLGSEAVWAVLGTLGLVSLYRVWRLRGRRAGAIQAGRGDPWPDVALALILVLVLATRLLEVRNLVVPAWVDSVHHTLLSQLIAETGRVPTSLMPYLPVEDLHYHFGFHSVAAVLVWLGGLSAPHVVLVLGQVLNTATVLATYALTSGLTGRRWAGVGAALATGALSIMPAYYVTWGRYTQLTGLVLLPLLCLLTIWLLDLKSVPWTLYALTAIGVAGLALTHYRMFVFYGLFCVCFGGWALWRGRAARRVWWRLLEVALLAGGVGLVLVLPWAARLLLRVIPQVGATYGGWSISGEYTALPTGLLYAGWVRSLQGVAAGGAIWALLRGKGKLVAVVVWVGLWFLAANLHLVGLRDIWLINNESVVIALWLPVSVCVGWLVGDLSALLVRGLPRALGYLPWREGVSALLLIGVTALAARGCWGLVDVVNPVTVMVTADDLRAIAWAAEHTPPDARFLINTRPWQGDLHVGSDAGWWLPILAHRQVSLPCLLYAQGPLAYRRAVLDLSGAVGQAKSLDDPALRERLAREGITHVFVGANGGRMLPKELDGSPHYRLLYALGAVRIYEMAPPETTSGTGI